ncbi:Protein lin-52 [Tyrophagus putrescentiae]|nr:Protein lin-52 [Tyrophagus putrescentiae]
MDSALGAATSVPITATERLDAARLLYSDENLDRRSPEMWPEQVPGVVNFISGSCPITEMEDNSLQELQFQSSQSSTNNHLEQSNQQIGNNSCGDFASIEAVSVKKYSRKFGFTGYGLASSAPEKKKHKSGGSTDNSDSEERGSLDDRNCESTENSSRASPVDGFLDNSMASQPSTSKGISNIIPKVERKPVKLPAKATVPDYQQGLDDEEVAMLYGFSSLTTSALLDKY